VPHVSMERVRQTYKRKDSWWTVLLVDPLAGRLVQVAVGRTWLTPTRLTVAAFVVGLAAAAAFRHPTPGWLVAGALLYYVSFAIDCVDGKIARLRQQHSVVGSWLDFLLDRVRVFVCTVALFSGLHHLTGDDRFLFAAMGVVFLSLIGYLNGAETDRANARMAAPAGAAGAAGNGAPTPQPEPALPSPVQRLRRFLHRHRIRMNLVSAVEFEMALFVVAPLVAAATGPATVLVVAAVAATLLVGFEAALMARFWLRARAYDRTARERQLPAPRPESRPPRGARVGAG
jgi:phosphatidylglycerophosphate synthase